MSASKLNNLVIGSARNSLLIPFHFGPFYLTARIMASVRHMVIDLWYCGDMRCS